MKMGGRGEGRGKRTKSQFPSEGDLRVFSRRAVPEATWTLSEISNLIKIKTPTLAVGTSGKKKTTY